MFSLLFLRAYYHVESIHMYLCTFQIDCYCLWYYNCYVMSFILSHQCIQQLPASIDHCCPSSHPVSLPHDSVFQWCTSYRFHHNTSLTLTSLTSLTSLHHQFHHPDFGAKSSVGGENATMRINDMTIVETQYNSNTIIYVYHRSKTMNIGLMRCILPLYYFFVSLSCCPLFLSPYVDHSFVHLYSHSSCVLRSSFHSSRSPDQLLSVSFVTVYLTCLVVPSAVA